MKEKPNPNILAPYKINLINNKGDLANLSHNKKCSLIQASIKKPATINYEDDTSMAQMGINKSIMSSKNSFSHIQKIQPENLMNSNEGEFGKWTKSMNNLIISNKNGPKKVENPYKPKVNKATTEQSKNFKQKKSFLHVKSFNLDDLISVKTPANDKNKSELNDESKKESLNMELSPLKTFSKQNILPNKTQPRTTLIAMGNINEWLSSERQRLRIKEESEKHLRIQDESEKLLIIEEESEKPNEFVLSKPSRKSLITIVEHPKDRKSCYRIHTL